MAITDQRTQHLDLPLPHQNNDMFDDVSRIRESFSKLDTDAGAKAETLAALKADLDTAAQTADTGKKDAAVATESARMAMEKALTAHDEALEGQSLGAAAGALAATARDMAQEALDRPFAFALDAPALALPPRIAIGREATLTIMPPAIMLPGASVSRYVVTLGTAAPIDVIPENGRASHTFQATGDAGTDFAVSVVAVDSVGNFSPETKKTAVLSDASIAAPSILSPASGEEQVSYRPTVTLSELSVIGDVQDTGLYTRVVIARDEAFADVLFDTGPAYGYATSVPVTVDLPVDTVCHIRAWHTGTAAGEGAPTTSTFRTITPKTAGIVLFATGGGAGTWQQTDLSLTDKVLTKAFFDAHPVYREIKEYSIDGQIMIKIPCFYRRCYRPDSGAYAGKRVWLISDIQLPGFEAHPAFRKPDGGIRECFYIGKYQASDTSSKMCSLPGKAPLVSIDFPTMVARAKARNTGGIEGFQLWDIHQLAAIQELYLIEYGNPDSQRLIGRGHVDNTPTGVQNVDHATVAQATYRGIVGLWGNIWQMCQGLDSQGTDGALRLWKNDGTQRWVDTGIVPPGTNNFVVSLREESGEGFDFTDVFFGNEMAVEASATIPDKLWSYKNCVLYVGGNYSNGSSCGLFCASLSNGSTYSNGTIGGRLAKL